MQIQEPKAKVKDIRFYSSFEGILEGKGSHVICCDEQRIMQVLLGLQTNALKFTQTGKVETRVEIKEILQEQFLKISVIDTGVGIAKEDHRKLFKLFGFVKDHNQLNVNGIGLGLVISKSICDQFDGDITFESEKGKGSTFSFTFKLQKIASQNIRHNKGIQTV